MDALTQTITHCPSQRFHRANTLFDTESSQAILVIDHPVVKAKIALQGAQLLTCSVNGQELLWLSPTAIFDEHTAIRGGIPLCLPWFGVNQKDTSLPKHGFARNLSWQLVEASETDIDVHWKMALTCPEHPQFATGFKAELAYRIDQQGIHAELSLHNLSASAAEFSYALHSYLAVEDSEQAFVTGLENTPFLDNTKNLETFCETDAIRFQQEIDRVYESCGQQQSLHSHHVLHIVSPNMPTAIVWNPHEKAKSVKDIGDAYRGYVCVERGAAFANSIVVTPEHPYQATMQILIN